MSDFEDYPSFSSFRPLLSIWDQYVQIETEVNDLLDNGNMIFFFKINNDLFGGPEDSRLLFAKLKADDDDEDPAELLPPNWKDEVQFLGMDLIKALTGEKAEKLFGLKDLANLKVISRDAAADELITHKKKKKK